MLLRPYLMLYRKRLIAGAIVALLTAVGSFLLTREGFCDCPPEPVPGSGDLILLIGLLLFLSLVLAVIFGLAVPARLPNVPSEARFLLTRPISRIAIQFYPLAISAAAIALLPALGWLFMLGCLRVFHPASLVHLVAIAEYMPAASALGPHPSFLQLMTALHMGRRYLAIVSVGLATYAPLAGNRWFIISPYKAVRKLALFPILMFAFVLWLPMATLSQDGSALTLRTALLLLPLKNHGLTYLPSNLGITLHLLFAAAWIAGTFAALREAEVWE